jgi:hypothetical protein
MLWGFTQKGMEDHAMSFPFFGEEFTFTQPDGTRLAVRGWGDQHGAVFETLDGYTVTRDGSVANLLFREFWCL